MNATIESNWFAKLWYVNEQIMRNSFQHLKGRQKFLENNMNITIESNWFVKESNWFVKLMVRTKKEKYISTS
jgi:hypothetical protein